MAATARVIWLCACVRYCRPRGWCLSVSLAFFVFQRYPTRFLTRAALRASRVINIRHCLLRLRGRKNKIKTYATGFLPRRCPCRASRGITNVLISSLKKTERQTDSETEKPFLNENFQQKMAIKPLILL